MTVVKIKNIEKKLLSDNWYVLNKYSYDYLKPDGNWERHHREVYDRGNGAAILLLNRARGTVILTNQFRMPTYVNGNESGMMIEACAGLLDGLNPEECIRKEVEEETGFKVNNVTQVMTTYMSPGSVTEILYLFIGTYENRMKVGPGGGSNDETEYLEVLELPFEQTLDMIATGEIKDAKTIILLQHAALQKLFAKPDSNSNP
ncbi:MAG: NUDIX domain-containing protein [Flavobacteriaceae bacterium]